MGQVKIFGLREKVAPIKEELSAVIHSCLVDAFKLPQSKRFHRFILMERDEFIFPVDRRDSYTIIEIIIFEGRSTEAKKEFIRLLFTRIQEKLDILPQDIEINIIETPKCNWGIRGLPGDELALNYKVEV